MDKLLILGASVTQKPLIEYAKKMGVYVIAFDMDKNAYCKNIVDEFYPISTTDLEKAFNKARELKIDGVVTYASDPSAIGVAYIGNKLNLPSNPYESVKILCNKGLFREFLQREGFNIPKFEVVNHFEELKNLKFSFPVIVKPVDSSGSRGVKKFFFKDEMTKDKIDKIFSFSKKGQIIIEEFIERKLYQVAGDGFLNKGKIVFISFANEHFNKDINGLVPIGESFPSVHDINILNKAKDVLQDILSKLKMQTGAFNFDFIIDKNNKIYILEIGPRNGGNLIPEVITLKDDFDMIKHTILSALKKDYQIPFHKTKNDRFFSSYMIYSDTDLIFDKLVINKEIEKNIVLKRLFVKKGDKVYKFLGANKAIGALILKFSSMEDMLYKMENMKKFISIKAIR